MKPVLGVVLAAVVALSPLVVLQAQADISGKWTYDPAKSRRGDLQFPVDLVIKQSPTEVSVESSATRQAAVTVTYRLDGMETTTVVPGGITVKAKAKMDGDKFLVDERRSFNTPGGELVNDIKEVYSVSGNTLTVQRTMTTGRGEQRDGRLQQGRPVGLSAPPVIIVLVSLPGYLA